MKVSTGGHLEKSAMDFRTASKCALASLKPKGKKRGVKSLFFDSTINLFFVTFFLAFLKISHDAKSTDRISQLLEIETSKKCQLNLLKLDFLTILKQRKIGLSNWCNKILLALKREKQFVVVKEERRQMLAVRLGNVMTTPYLLLGTEQIGGLLSLTFKGELRME